MGNLQMFLFVLAEVVAAFEGCGKSYVKIDNSQSFWSIA